MDWLAASERTVTAAPTPTPAGGATPAEIRSLIDAHKQFQRSLGAKQPTMDGVSRAGRLMRDRCPPPDRPVIQTRLGELKARWNSVCSKSVDRYGGARLTGRMRVVLGSLGRRGLIDGLAHWADGGSMMAHWADGGSVMAHWADGRSMMAHWVDGGAMMAHGVDWGSMITWLTGGSMPAHWIDGGGSS